MADDKMKVAYEVYEKPCELCGEDTDQQFGDHRYVCRLCYNKSDESRQAIDAYVQHPQDYADLTMPEYLDRMFEEK